MLVGVSMLLLAAGALAELLAPVANRVDFAASLTAAMFVLIGVFALVWGGAHVWAAVLMKRRRPLGTRALAGARGRQSARPAVWHGVRRLRPLGAASRRRAPFVRAGTIRSVHVIPARPRRGIERVARRRRPRYSPRHRHARFRQGFVDCERPRVPSRSS